MVVHLLIRNSELRDALRSMIRSNGHVCIDDLRPECATGTCGHLVIATATGLSLRHCRELVKRGARVVLLTALPSALEQQDYIDAGASDYLTMGIDDGRLRDALFGTAA